MGSPHVTVRRKGKYSGGVLHLSPQPHHRTPMHSNAGRSAQNCGGVIRTVGNSASGKWPRRVGFLKNPSMNVWHFGSTSRDKVTEHFAGLVFCEVDLNDLTQS